VALCPMVGVAEKLRLWMHTRRSNDVSVGTDRDGRASRLSENHTLVACPIAYRTGNGAQSESGCMALRRSRGVL
jgi:hypothetical protein